MLGNISRLAIRQGAGRGAIRHLAGWSNMETSVPQSRRAELRSLLADISKRKDAAQSVEAPAAIDWKAFEADIGADEVAKIKKEYDAQTYTDFSADVKKTTGDLEGDLSKTLEELRTQQDLMAQYSADAESQKEKVLLSYTSEDTTLEDVLERHPELDAKYERQIENHEWDTDLVDAHDVSAKRIALMEERWDSAVMGGKLDENMQKEIVAEMENIASQNKGGASSLDIDDSVRAHITEMAELVGEPVPEDATLQKWLELGNGELSEAESAVKDEPTLFAMMEHYNTLGLTAKAEAVRALYEELETNETLEIDETWRATEGAKSAAAPDVSALGDFCPSELDGKTSEEVEAMADEAAANNEYWRATQILMQYHRNTGDLDSSKDVNTFSGLANYMDKIAHAMLGKN